MARDLKNKTKKVFNKLSQELSISQCWYDHHSESVVLDTLEPLDKLLQYADENMYTVGYSDMHLQFWR